MSRYSNLIVVGEPEIEVRGGSRNNALNEILNYYTAYADKVIYLAPGNANYVLDKVEFRGISSYSKEKRFIFKDFFKITKKIRGILNENVSYHIQFRVPSLFSLQIYWIMRSFINPKNISFYVAGDWGESLKLNHPEKKILNLLPKLQEFTLNNKVCVFTGDTLLNRNKKKILRGYAFYSTTHKQLDIVKPSLDSSFKRKNICFIGRLENLKNPDFIINLASMKELSEYHFYILGDGPLRESLEKKVLNNNIQNITFTGHINDRLLFDEIVNKCKYYVLPSYTEGTPKTLPEMMSKGVLPIAFKNVGSNEYILREGGGLIDIDSVTQAIDFIKKCDEDFMFYKNHNDNIITYAYKHSIEKELSSMFAFIYN